MRSYSRVPFVALAVAFLILPLGAGPGFAQPADTKVEFQLPDEALRALAAERPQVGAEYAFDLCRGKVATEAGPGQLNPSDSTCGDALNPSATVRGGNPPYHFQLEPMGGFPPMGMWVDLNGVLRGTPKSTRGASFGVCAVDMSGRSDCERITIEGIRDASVAVEQPAASAARKSGGSGGKAALAVIGAGVAVGGALYAGKLAGDLAAMSTCASNRFCIVSVMGSGCSCAGSVDGGCDWTGPTAGSGGSCGSGTPCAAGLSCNNGRCEGPSGRCPF